MCPPDQFFWCCNAAVKELWSCLTAMSLVHDWHATEYVKIQVQQLQGSAAFQLSTGGVTIGK